MLFKPADAAGLLRYWPLPPSSSLRLAIIPCCCTYCMLYPETCGAAAFAHTLRFLPPCLMSSTSISSSLCRCNATSTSPTIYSSIAIINPTYSLHICGFLLHSSIIIINSTIHTHYIFVACCSAAGRGRQVLVRQAPACAASPQGTPPRGPAPPSPAAQRTPAGRAPRTRRASPPCVGLCRRRRRCSGRPPR